MSNTVFNVAKGRAVELYSRVENNDPANAAFVVVMLKLTETDALLEDYDDLAAVLAAAGNTEADFTSYARLTFTDVELAALPATDDAGNRRTLTFPNAFWAAAGGAVNNTLPKLLLCYDPDTTAGDDSNIEPLFAFDYGGTTDGVSDIDLDFPDNALVSS